MVFQLFDEKLAKKIVVEGPYEAQQVMSMVRMANFVGSGTDIDNALRRTVAGIRKLPKRKTPDHVVLVSDGKAEITIQGADCKGIRLHCFMLGGSNEALRAISQQTGGVYQEC